MTLATYVVTRDETVLFSTDDKDVVIAYLLSTDLEEHKPMFVNGENSRSWLFDNHTAPKRNGVVRPEQGLASKQRQ